MEEFFSNWETKDTITLIFSIVAIIFSTVTLIQKIAESNRALRKQLTDILEKITSINIESEKAKANSVGLPTNYQGLLNEQRRFFVRQAAYLSKKINRDVSPYEWNIIAWGWVRIDEVEAAEECFRRAIERAKSNIDKGLTLRSFAGFLTDERKFDLANEYFQNAMDVFKGNGDRMIYYRATTYERWAQIFQKNNVEYTNKIDQVIREWGDHSNKNRAETEIKRVRPNLAPVLS